MLVVIVAGVFLGLKLDEIYPNQHSLFTLIFFSINISFSQRVIYVPFIKDEKIKIDGILDILYNNSGY